MEGGEGGLIRITLDHDLVDGVVARGRGDAEYRSRS